MSIQHETIFQRAMASQKPDAILQVAQAFEMMGLSNKSRPLYQRAYSFGFAFGAMARGTPVKDTNGAVIPPGRYWLDVLGDKRKIFTDWAKGKPEVRIESTEDHADENRLFVIFTIPTTANNYGLSGAFFPTNVLGFPTIATNVTSSADTIQRPDPMTSTDVMADISKAIGEALGAGAKGAGKGLGISTTTIILVGVGTLFGLFMLNRLMIPKLSI